MKTRLLKLIHTLSVLLVILFIFLAVFFALLRAVAPLVAYETPRAETIVSDWLGKPVKINALSLQWHWLTPVLKAQSVSLWNPDASKNLFEVGEIDSGVNIWQSLIHRKLIVDFVTFKNASLTVRQENHQWHVDALSELMPKSDQKAWTLSDLQQKLAPWHKLTIQGIHVDLYPDQGEHFQMDIATARWQKPYFGSEQLSLKLHLLKPTDAKIDLVINNEGPWDDLNKASFVVAAKVRHLALAPFSSWLSIQGDQILDGSIDGVIDAKWHDHKLSDIYIQTVLDHWKVRFADKSEDLTIRHVNLSLDGEWSKTFWKLYGDIDQLSVARFEKWPGVDHLTTKIFATSHQGKIWLDSNNITIDFGKVFASPIALETLQGEVSWVNTLQGWEVKARQFYIQNTDVTAGGTMDMLFAPETSPWVNIESHFSLTPFAAKHLNDYLPRTMLDQDLIDWLTQSVKSFDGGEGQFVLRGYLKDFPYVDKPGEFLIDSDLRNITLDYHHDWPAATHLYTELIFSGDAMEAKVSSAVLSGVSVKNVFAEIPVLGKESILLIDGKVNADVKSMMHFILNSPLKKHIGQRFKGMIWSGPADLDLKLKIQIAKKPVPEKEIADGVLTFDHNLLQIPAWQIALKQFQGSLQITGEGITGKQLRGYLFGEPVTLNIDTDQVAAAGDLAIKALPRTIGIKLLPYLQGKIAYQLKVLFGKGDNAEDKTIVTSTLEGLNINLPAPFTKSPDKPANFQVILYTKAGEVERYALKYNNMKITLTPVKQNYLLNITYPQMNGQLSFAKDDFQNGLKGRFQNIYILSDSSKKPLKNLDPREVPPLDLMVNDLRYNNKRFGGINLQASRQRNGLSIDKLYLGSSSYQISAKGIWTQLPGSLPSSQLYGTLRSGDFAKMLSAFQIPSSIQSKNAKVQFNLMWAGAIYSPAVSSLDGSIHFDIKKGEIVNVGSKAKMDVGRLLSLLSFQSIQRRLTLDFSDWTQPGLNFDTLSGDFQLNNGIAYTSNTSLDSEIADIEMKGSINLSSETYNLSLSVTPHLTSSLPLIATIAGGPVAGAVTWAASKIVNPVLGKITTDRYSVTGSFSNPVISARTT